MATADLQKDRRWRSNHRDGSGLDKRRATLKHLPTKYVLLRKSLWRGLSKIRECEDIAQHICVWFFGLDIISLHCSPTRPLILQFI